MQSGQYGHEKMDETNVKPAQDVQEHVAETNVKRFLELAMLSLPVTCG